MDYHFNLLKIFDAVMAKKIHLVFTGILALLASLLLVSSNLPDTYHATSTIFAVSYESYSDSVEGMNIIRDYAEVVNSTKVADLASSYLLNEVTSKEIQQMVSSAYSTDSNIITILAQSDDPEIAVKVANAVANAFIQEMISITSEETIQVLDSATTARLVQQGALMAWVYRFIIVVGAVGCFAAVIIVLAAIDTKVCFPSEVTLDGKIELLGIIPDKNSVKSNDRK